MKSLQIISNLAVGEGVLRDFLASSPVCIAFGSISLARGDGSDGSGGSGGAPFQRRALAAARRQELPVLVVDPEVEVEGLGLAQQIHGIHGIFMGNSWENEGYNGIKW